jgi:SWIM zinc finger
MPEWSPDQVRALAPDPSSLQAAAKLARVGGWSEAGSGGDPASVWGLCQGSGKSPYQTCVDLVEPAYRCSCPSRKFPCKHALALMLLWAGGEIKEADPPDWVREWHEGRASRGARKATSGAPRTEAQEKAAAKRAAARQQRVASGVAELRQWLSDQVRHGIAGTDQLGYKHFENLAARLIDAQAPGLAGAVQAIAAIPSSGPGWEERLLTEFAMLHLLTTASAATSGLPDDLAAVARVRVGQAIPTEQVLATPPVRDVWRVIGLRDSHEDRLSVRRVWLIGAGTGREALVLSYAMPGQALPSDLLVGQAVDADLCFYPGIRALVSAKHGIRFWDAGGADPDGKGGGGRWGVSVAEALRRLTDGLAADPWLQGWPMLLRGSIVPGDRWHVVDSGGDALPLDARCGDQWRFLAASGGAEAVIAAEWSWAGLIPLTMFFDGEVILP